MQVGRLVLDDEGEQFSEIHYNPPSGASEVFFFAASTHYGSNRGQPASCEQRAHAPRAPGVTLLAVSKSQPVERIERSASPPGQKAFGENYVQEAVQKMEALARRSNGT